MHACTRRHVVTYKPTCTVCIGACVPVPIHTRVHNTHADLDKPYFTVVPPALAHLCRVLSCLCPFHPCPFLQCEDSGPSTMALASLLSPVACGVGSGLRKRLVRRRQTLEGVRASPMCMSGLCVSAAGCRFPWGCLTRHSLLCSHAVDAFDLLVNGICVLYFLIFFGYCQMIEIPLLFFMLTL